MWIGTRLVHERERACDEVVLRRFDERGGNPGQDAVLRGLREAYTSIASLPGGDFGGLRSRIQQEISAAMTKR